ncbi:MAG: choice-of-anchor B family protein [Rhodothermales bacterium]|nr:choice-of-anchor B family protein [Rhodothermales bacterium]
MNRIFSLLVLALVLAAPAAAQTFRADVVRPEVQGFGGSVAVSGGLVAVGEPQNTMTPGAVYLFAEDGSGTWTETARLAGPDAFANDHFGQALALSGGTLVTTATRPDGERGAVYVYEQGADGWALAATLTAEGAAEGARLGSALAFDGDAILASTSPTEGAGAAYVFRRGADGAWMQEARLTADAEGEMRFGSSVALGDGWAFVGASGQEENTGAVYAFQRQADGTWAQQAVLTGTGIEGNSRFGDALLLAGGTLYVGAPGHEQFSGAVYTFGYDAEDGAWSEAGTLVPFDGARQMRFGMALAQSGDALWVGAPGASSFEGRIYLFSQDADGMWTGATKLAADDLRRGSFFAATLAVDGDVAAAGIVGADYGAGKAVVFHRTAEGWAVEADLAGPPQGMAAVTGEMVECSEGEAAGFDCKDVDLVSFLPVHAIGGKRGVRTNDVWGWTDAATNREYAIVGMTDGTSFVDVTDPYTPRYLGFLPKTDGSPGSTWRDMKVYQNHAFIVSDGAGQHGMQVFDLTKLRDVDGMPAEFEADAHYDGIASSHNIVINEDTGFAYAVGNSAGGETCGGGLHMIDIRQPDRPTFAGCFGHEGTGRRGTGYTHDAQCVVYHGPDADHQGREICFNANETALSIADVTDKQNPVALAAATYPKTGYTHQGWLTEDHRFFFVNDELDEIQGSVTEGTRTLIWDVSDLDDPQLVKEHFGTEKSSDHNLYVRGNLMYQSNYVSGLRVLDVSDPANPVEVGYFDTVPYGDNSAGFNGSWSNYPYFQSGVIIVTSGREGLFVLKKKAIDL